MSDIDDGQLDPGYTGDDQPDTFGGHDVDLGHIQAGQEHSALEQLHTDHGSESDLDQQFGVYGHDFHQAETNTLEHGVHIESSHGYDEGEQPAFTGGDINDLHDRLSGLGDEPGGEAQLGVASS
jgi:hypothetical protein